MRRTGTTRYFMLIGNFDYAMRAFRCARGIFEKQCCTADLDHAANNITRMRYLSLLVALASCLVSHAQIISSREEAVELIRELRKIHTAKGIELLQQVTLNGEKQWISIRGKDQSNPVLLFIHGGPASPVMPVSWAFQNPWEDYFTVVQWDQRVSGKNWLTADTARAKVNLNRDEIVHDGLALVDYLRETLRKEKIFIMGYSFGASVGIRMAAAIPEKLHAYIGVGQPSPGDPEGYLYTKLMELAKAEKNEAAANELKAIAPYPKPGGSSPREILVTRKWARYYNGGWYGKRDISLYFSLPALAPEYSKQEVESLEVSTPWSTRKIIRAGRRTEFDYTFSIPIIFMMGEHDLHTPYEPCKAYFDKITAPKKEFYSFRDSGHFPFLEEPGRFLVTLVNDVLPLKE